MAEKHIELDKNTIEIHSDDDIKNILSIDWGATPLVPKCPRSVNGFHALDKKALVCPFKQGWRLPWDMLDKTNLYEMNYHVTIAPDPIHETDFYSRKIANKVLRLFLSELKRNKLYKNIICVYEYGSRGKTYGKLHWHILFKTNKIRKIEDMSNKYFATSKKRSKNTTVIKRIRIDKNYVDRSDADKVANYKAQVDYIMREYMQKESQNKTKCLYTNMIIQNNIL